MDTLLHKLGEKVKGIIEGFDRIVFKGRLMPLCYPGGFSNFLQNRGVLNKDYKDFMTQTSAIIENDAKQVALESGVGDVIYLPSSRERKETIAHHQQEKLNISEGLVGVWSCVENCRTFRSVFDKTAGFPQLNIYNSRCKHLYFYIDHSDYGFMSIRLQTWAPYEIQIALNGREWLRRQLEKKNVGFLIQGNKFLHIDDFETAQISLNNQVESRWIELLDAFVPSVFPAMSNLIGNQLSYTWTLWQSEWARDYIFSEPEMLNQIMPMFLRHAFISGNSDRVLRYLGKPVKANGQPFPNSNPELMSKLNLWYDGGRIRHFINHNSVKMYNEQNVLRFEFTMNDPTQYKVHRTVEGSTSEEKKYLPMRKGIADVTVRAQVCATRLNNFIEQIATLTEDSSVSDIISKLATPVTSNGKKFRGLEVMGKDRALIEAICDPKFCTDAISNKALYQMLVGTSWAKGMTGKKLSARISRALRLLREHGLIRKLPKQHKYYLSQDGRLATTAFSQCLGAKISDLAKLTA